MNLRIVFFSLIVAFVFTACGDNSNPSNPQVKTYTVTFDADNGSEPTAQTVDEGGTVAKPANPSKMYTPPGLYAGTPPTACTFVEWQKPDGSAWNFTTDTITADITLTAKWTTPSPIDITNETGSNIVEKAVSYVNANGGSEYTLVLGESMSDVAPQTLDQNDTTLTITSDGNTERIISLGSNGVLFRVGGTLSEPCNTKLVIDGYITLIGREDNTVPLLHIRYGGSLDLKGNAKITGNTRNYTSDSGSGICSAVSIQGGNIGDVFETIFTMRGNAEISGNTVNRTGTGIANGGGVHIRGYSSFTISENAVIKNNNGTDFGGGVYVDSNSVFIMDRGEIFNNTATNNGGGVYVYVGGTFTVADEQVKAGIHSNTATNGSQVYVATDYQGGTFTVGGEPAGSF